MIRSTSIFRSALIICLPLFIVFSSPKADIEKTKVTLGAKGISGPFFPTAGTVASAVNRTLNDHGIRITVKTRHGSASVIGSVISGEFEFGAAQSRIIYQAYNGLAAWNGLPQKGLRSICNIHAEQVVCVASVKSGIRNIRDLIGRRVFIGGPRIDLLDTVRDILSAVGIDPHSDLIVTGNAVEDAPELMRDDAIDAFFYIMGITDRTFIDLFSGPQQMALIPITGAGIDELTAANPFYKKSVVSIKSYPYFRNETDVETVSVKSGLVALADVPDRIVFTIAKEVFENLDDYKNRHPTASVLTRRELTESLAAPVHTGAARFFKQSGTGYSVIKP